MPSPGKVEPQLSKVSLGVVRLAIERVEPSLDCYAAVGKELAAQQLLFAQIVPGPRPESVRVTVTVTWFDIEEKRRKRSVENSTVQGCGTHGQLCAATD